MTSSKPSEPEGNALLFESLVICDDIRSESNGKLILVGVYSDVIQVAKLPLQMRSLALGIKARAMAVGRMRFSVVVADPQGNTLLDAGGELDYQGERLGGSSGCHWYWGVRCCQPKDRTQ